jgi:putative FmdB family regulatory protein
MPIYEFRCNTCRQHQSVWRTYFDVSSPRCTVCGADNLTRLVSRISVVTSDRDRARDLSWIDRDVAHRLTRVAGGKLSTGLADTLDRMKSA